MMLIPFGFVAPQFKYRTTLLAETLEEGDFNIIGLQEIFSDSAQDRILETWHGQDENLWMGIKEAREVSTLAAEKNKFGIQIIDAKPNSLPAKISFGPYYVLGPDCAGINLFKQDSGLMILSRVPVIAASAFSFSQMKGSDRFANKGVLYARLKTGKGENDYIHFFTTHLQSHDYPEARLSNLKELLLFVFNIISVDISENIGSQSENGDLKGAFSGINPVIITGDINIRAFVPEDWAQKAGIIGNTAASDAKNGEVPENLPYKYGRQIEYKSFIDEVKNFINTLNPAQDFYLKDLWAVLYPAEPGFTWIGKGWRVNESNPYGIDGNQYAIEEGPPERIDYILFFGGNRDFSLKPQNLVLYPANGSGIQLSDHLGISCSLQLVDNLKN
jgi:endonuclease/exonuclease/phosphatase family metal-dependent hydrolase